MDGDPTREKAMSCTAKSMIASVLAFNVADCLGSLSHLAEQRTPLPPTEAEKIVEKAFLSLNIPVVERITDGRIRSGRFNPEEAWGGLLWDRITCGVDSNAPRTTSPTAVELEVISTIRLDRQTGARVFVESYGHGISSSGEKLQCRISPETVAAILGSLPRHRGSGPPS